MCHVFLNFMFDGSVVYARVCVKREKGRFSQLIVSNKKNKIKSRIKNIMMFYAWRWCTLFSKDPWEIKKSKETSCVCEGRFNICTPYFSFSFDMASPNILYFYTPNIRKRKKLIYFPFLTQYDKLPKYVCCMAKPRKTQH